VRSDAHDCESVSLSTNDLIRSIGGDSFVKEVLEESRPVLVLCMHRDSEFQAQIDIIEDMCRSYGDRLKACLIEDEFNGAFKEKFNVKGTPTFMIFIGGTEKGRMLGQVEQKTWEEFVSRILSLDRGGM
jgi:thioredoxin-like negative regulator of GroEL